MALRRSFLFIASAIALAGACTASTADSASKEADAQLSREILDEIIRLRTSKGHGQTVPMAEALAARLREAGFAAEDIDIPTMDIDGETVAGLVVRYRGEGSGKKPIVFLAHMDVVDAAADAWATPPFEPVEKDGYLYGRGSVDNKAGVALLTATFIQMKKEGFEPNRDLVIAFTGDEETGMQTTRMLTKHRWVKGAEYALNADAGVGTVGADGGTPAFSIQSAEKTYATFHVTARNRGGHSSAPRADNAIFDLADAIKAIEAHKFPVAFNDITKIMAENLAENEGGEFAEALRALMQNPADEEARAVVEANPTGAHFLYTTCVPTMLSAGVAENALPQRATATVNCRILPGTSVAEVKNILGDVIGNDGIEIELQGERVESPISPINEDLFASLEKAVHVIYPGANLIPSMSSGGTDGREFRSAGIPTYGAGALVLKRPDDFRAHGLDERLPLESYGKQLDFWRALLKDLAGGE